MWSIRISSRKTCWCAVAPPLQLVITDFGISSLTSDGLVATEKALTFEYAPIEVMMASSSRVIFESTRVDYWSLGMMLVEMLTGAHPYHEYDHDTIRYQLLQNADWLTEDIEDGDWLKLCRGLLRRTAENRWTAEHVSKWLADPEDPSLRADEAPEADAVPLEAIINFDGTGYTTPDDLGRGAVAGLGRRPPRSGRAASRMSALGHSMA